VKVFPETHICCGFFGVLVRFVDIEGGQSPSISHNCELSVLNILDLAIYSKQLSKYRFSSIIQSKNNKFNQPIFHKYLSKTHTYHK
jgi:hypothetical protein